MRSLLRQNSLPLLANHSIRLRLGGVVAGGGPEGREECGGLGLFKAKADEVLGCQLGDVEQVGDPIVDEVLQAAVEAKMAEVELEAAAHPAPTKPKL